MSIQPGMIFVSAGDGHPLQGLYRVLQVLPGADLVLLINIPSGPRKAEGTKQKNYYVRGFLKQKLSDMTNWEENKLICETTMSWPSLWNMTDEAIREKFPPRKGKSESHVLSERDRKWALIQPFLPDQERIAMFNYMELGKNVEAGVSGVNASKGQLLDALHRYFAFGCIKNALLPNTPDCGARDIPRIAKKGRKHGRKNAAALVGNTELQGKILTEDDRKNLKDGWNMYVRPEKNVGEAFISMSQVFYSTDYSLKNGVWVPNLFDAHLRPTEREFRYHGPRGNNGESAARRLMGEGEWLKNERELIGSARTGVVAFGQVGSIDASPIDVNLVCCFNRLRPIGVGRAIVVTDVYSGLVVGWHVAIGGIGADEANLAILNAAIDKTEMLNRYGLTDLSPADFPVIFFSKIISDNGELRCIKGIGSSVERLGSRIEFIPSGRADLNSISESGHHSRHRGLDHHLQGTTKGRQKKRGEPLSITKALLSHYEYSRLLIQWIHWKNTKQEVPHLLTTEMRRDKVQPTRIAIYRWAKNNGYIAGRMIDPTFLKAHLLPTFTASIQRNGLVLHRPKSGEAVELLPRARFNDSYLATSGLIRAAINGGKKHIEVKANPDDLSYVYLIDVNGIHVIKNICDDLILVQEGCISDLGVMNDVDRQQKIETRSQREQDNSDMHSFRVEQEAQASDDKKLAQSTEKTRPKPKTDRSSVRENQADERCAQLDGSVMRAFGDVEQISTDEVFTTVPDSKKIPKEIGVTERPKVNDITALRIENMKNFHAQRKI
jgi:hypothetical protein